MTLRTVILISSVFLLSGCGNPLRSPYQNTRLDFETRVEDLVSRMTLEEKVSQMLYDADEIAHLGIPQYNWWNESLHGVARAGKATVFPQSIAMASTFDRELVFRMAEITSTEARAKYNDFQSRGKRGIYQGLTFWSPNINIFRDPRWGRGHETYGEDPYLTGEMGVAFIRGLQGDHSRYLKVVATTKHYVVHSGPEPLRHQFDAVIGERDFRDTYLPAFKKTVEQGRVYSVMCAYNRYMGDPCCGSTYLLEDVLRGELGFQGYVVSDCGAIGDFQQGHFVTGSREESAALGVLSGTDLNCGNQYTGLVKAVEQGLISEAELDTSVMRLMLARMKLGMFDPEEMVPWSRIPVDTVACIAHRDVSLEMARKSIVLLKNANGVLPMNREIKKIAVIGPNAHYVDVQYGNYNGTPVAPVSVLDGIRAAAGDAAEVRFAVGSPHHAGMPYLVLVPEKVLFRDREGSEPGLNVSYYPNLECEGEPLQTGVVPTVDFYGWDGEPPAAKLTDDDYSVEWSGFLLPDRSGIHSLGVEGKYVRLILDGDTLINHHNIHHPNKIYRKLELAAGKPYGIRIMMSDRQGDASCRLYWEEPGLPLLWEAVEVAEWAEHVILVMGLTPWLEGEEMRGLQLEGFSKGDRTSLDLPEIQSRLIRRIASTGRPVTLVLMSGSALSVDWENDHIPAILQAWYGGETAGTAVAEVLFGNYNPAGRLPVTFYHSVDELPDFDDYSMKGRTYRYFEGGVLYPFGYGLSYTTFSYDNLILEQDEISAGESLSVSVDVTNTGRRDGEEVVQLYIRDVESDEVRPHKELKGFRRVSIKSGQTLTVAMTLHADELVTYDISTGDYIVEPGLFEIMVGPSSDSSVQLIKELIVR